MTATFQLVRHSATCLLISTGVLCAFNHADGQGKTKKNKDSHRGLFIQHPPLKSSPAAMPHVCELCLVWTFKRNASTCSRVRSFSLPKVIQNFSNDFGLDGRITLNSPHPGSISENVTFKFCFDFNMIFKESVFVCMIENDVRCVAAYR